MAYYPRAFWTERPNKWTYKLAPSEVNQLAIHWPGTVIRSYAGLSPAAIGRIIRGFESHHINARGWPGIGYCYLVDLAGNVYEGAGDRRAAHSATGLYKDANRHVLGVQLILGIDDKPSPAMIQSVRDLYTQKLAKFPRLGSKPIIGHRDVPGAGTACPGPAAHALIKSGAFYPSATTRPTGTPVPAKPNAPAPAASVAWIQETLTITGHYMGRVDGDYGPRTRAAVTEYQTAHHPPLVVDGDAGPRTTTHMEETMTEIIDRLARIEQALAGLTRMSQILEAVDVRTGPEHELRTNVRATLAAIDKLHVDGVPVDIDLPAEVTYVRKDPS